MADVEAPQVQRSKHLWKGPGVAFVYNGFNLSFQMEANRFSWDHLTSVATSQHTSSAFYCRKIKQQYMPCMCKRSTLYLTHVECFTITNTVEAVAVPLSSAQGDILKHASMYLGETINAKGMNLVM